MTETKYKVIFLIVMIILQIIDCVLYAKLSPKRDRWGWWNKMPMSGFIMAMTLIYCRLTNDATDTRKSVAE
jgi:hypothetical protein